MDPRVGIAVFVFQAANDKFLVGKRKGSHGAGTWGLPGGHLEPMECFNACARRELEEETGLIVDNTEELTITNDIMHDDNKHYVTVFLRAKLKDSSAEPRILEPEKCEEWRWVSWEEIVEMVKKKKGAQGDTKYFLPLVNLVSQRPGFSPLGSPTL